MLFEFCTFRTMILNWLRNGFWSAIYQNPSDAQFVLSHKDKCMVLELYAHFLLMGMKIEIFSRNCSLLVCGGGWRWKFQITEDNQFRKMYWQPNGRVKENKRVQCKIRSKRNCCLIRSTNTLTNIRHSINCCFNWNDMVARIVSIYTTLKFFPLSFFPFF